MGPQRKTGSSGALEKMGDSQSNVSVLGTGVGRVSVKELGRRLHRDPSIISRLYSTYVADRDQIKGETVSSTTSTLM